MAEQKFNFKEVDIEGEEILNVISAANKFNEWIYSAIKPYCSGNVLEIGSGTGNISQFFVRDDYNITCSDLRTRYCEILTSKFSDQSNFQGTIEIDLVDPLFDEKFKSLFGTFDTVYSLNVIEHIFEDTLAIQNCKKLLKQGGNLIILVPAYQKLFNGFDKALEHYRRYTIKTLKPLFINNNLNVIASRYYNFMGIFAWFISGNILRNETFPEGQMKFFNALVPLFKLADFLVFKRIGLSVIMVGQKGKS